MENMRKEFIQGRLQDVEGRGTATGGKYERLCQPQSPALYETLAFGDDGRPCRPDPRTARFCLIVRFAGDTVSGGNAHGEAGGGEGND
jgi:hypothetical protein